MRCRVSYTHTYIQHKNTTCSKDKPKSHRVVLILMSQYFCWRDYMFRRYLFHKPQLPCSFSFLFGIPLSLSTRLLYTKLGWEHVWNVTWAPILNDVLVLVVCWSSGCMWCDWDIPWVAGLIPSLVYFSFPFLFGIPSVCLPRQSKCVYEVWLCDTCVSWSNMISLSLSLLCMFHQCLWTWLGNESNLFCLPMLFPSVSLFQRLWQLGKALCPTGNSARLMECKVPGYSNDNDGFTAFPWWSMSLRYRIVTQSGQAIDISFDGCDACQVSSLPCETVNWPRYRKRDPSNVDPLSTCPVMKWVCVQRLVEIGWTVCK